MRPGGEELRWLESIELANLTGFVCNFCNIHVLPAIKLCAFFINICAARTTAHLVQHVLMPARFGLGRNLFFPSLGT